MEKHMDKIGRKKANKCIGQTSFSNLKTRLLPIIWPKEESQLNVWAFVFAMYYAAVEPVLSLWYMYITAIFISDSFPSLQTRGQCCPSLARQYVG